MRGALALAVCTGAALSFACGEQEKRWVRATVDVVLDPSLSISPDDPRQLLGGIQVDSAPGGGWRVSRTFLDAPERMEQIQLWCASGSPGNHGEATVWRYTDTKANSSMYLDELSGVHGTIRVNGIGLPSADQRRVVAYSLEGSRGETNIRLSGSFDFGASDLDH